MGMILIVDTYSNNSSTVLTYLILGIVRRTIEPLRRTEHTRQQVHNDEHTPEVAKDPCGVPGTP